MYYHFNLVLDNELFVCNLCRKKFSFKDLNIHSVECEFFEVYCNQCQDKFPKNIFRNHNCIPYNRSLQILDYLRESNQNLIQIFGNFTNTLNVTERSQPAYINNLQNPIQNTDEINCILGGLSILLTKLNLKVDEKFNMIMEQIKEIKQERNINCHICKSRKADDTCVTCNLKFCEVCINKCKICELQICNNCPVKFEKCLKECKNFICKNCLKLLNGNKKFKIVENEFDNEKLCTKDVCFTSKSKRFINSYIIGSVIWFILIIYIYFK